MEVIAKGQVTNYSVKEEAFDLGQEIVLLNDLHLALVGGGIGDVVGA